MIKVKDFQVGQEACFLKLSSVMNKYDLEAGAVPVTVKKVGRLYVTCNDGMRYEKSDTCEFGLMTEGSSWGALFLNEEDMEKELEKRELARWLGDKSFFSTRRYSLEQLKKVKEILGE